jgi:uncharacterized membrane protein
MLDQIQILKSHTDDRSLSAKDRRDEFESIAIDSFFITAAGVALLALLASIWLAMVWPLSNDVAAISGMFP